MPYRAKVHNLTPRQAFFVAHYLADPELNATRAAKTAGYAPKTAHRTASELLKLPHVRCLVDRALKRRLARLEVTADRVLSELARVAFADLRRVMTWGPDGVKLTPSGELSEDDAAAVAEVSETTTKDGGSLHVKLHSKPRALELLARNLGLLRDKLQIDMTENFAAQLDAARKRLNGNITHPDAAGNGQTEHVAT